MKTHIINTPYDNKTIEYCIKELKNGNIGIFPTDTVYGIGCDSLNILALQSLYNIKNRDINKPINILISDTKMVHKYVKNINPIEEKLMNSFWPGALTIIFNKSDIVPDLLTSGLNTIGIRMPNNKICLEIIDKFGKPLAVSSANMTSKTPNFELKGLLEDFDNKVSFIINDENLNKSIPSTIVRVENNEIKILRKGIISKEDIQKCFGGNINVR